MEKKKKKWVTYSAALAAFVIFLLPLVNNAVQIDLAALSSIPTHWQMVISGAFGGGIATATLIMKKYYEDNEVDMEKKVELLIQEKEKLSLERDISERDIMLNSAQLNNDWLAKNMSIRDVDEVLQKMKENADKET
jgi:hypothetical protein